MVALAAMANDFNAVGGVPSDRYTAEGLSAFLFGPGFDLCCIVAERDGTLIGYATYHDNFDPTHADVGLFMTDLYVAAEWRNQGIGRRMMAAIARDAVDRGRVSFSWGVEHGDTDARRFYQRAGARDSNGWLLEMDSAELRTLAEEAPADDA